MSVAYSEFLKRNPFTIQRKVYWGDMDAFGHVNNVQYFRYFEDLRTEFFLTHLGGIGIADYKPVAAEISCQFLTSLVYPDELHLGLSIQHIGNSQVIHRYEIFSCQQDQPVATGTTRIVNIDSESGKKASIPEVYINIFKNFLTQHRAENNHETTP